MALARLDKGLKDKIAKKLEKKPSAISVMVSKKAARLAISSEAALILIAKEYGIGTAVYQRRLDPSKQAEVRESLPSLFQDRKIPKLTTAKSSLKARKKLGKRSSLRLAIEYVIKDPELRSRCEDLLLAKANFDRAINQATQVLEHRIRNKSQPGAKLVGENLVGYAFNADPSRTVLKVSDNPEEQRGFTGIIRGVVPAFRNPTHHHLTGTFTREEALRVCGFIDVLLRIIANCVKIH